MGWPAVQGYKDGDSVTAAVLNKPLNQLAERTDYLYNLFKGNDHTKVCVTGAVVVDLGYGLPVTGQPVYRVPGTDTYAVAAGITSENEWFYADPMAMAVGVYEEAVDGTHTIVLCGRTDFSAREDPVLASDIISDRRPASGRHYLSATTGRLTRHPKGPVIYVCDVQLSEDGTRVVSLLVNPQYRDTGESHIHRTFVVSGLPLGSYAVKAEGRYTVSGILPDGVAPTVGTLPSGLSVLTFGEWPSDVNVTYKLSVVRKASGSASEWVGYQLAWQSAAGQDDGAGTADISFSSGLSPLIPVGSHGLYVRLAITDGTTPASVTGKVWTVAMPAAAQGWANYTGTAASGDEGRRGFVLNLGMYPAMARYVPPVPANGADVTVSGVSLRSGIFGSRSQWRILPADADLRTGPRLVWYGGEVDADSVTTPFVWTADTVAATGRDIVLHVNRMRVGPTGFVTSLQAAPGSPIKVTSAQTGAAAEQGALQIALDVDFTTSEGNVAGARVVKRITGTTFETGLVVERVVAGPGMSVDHEQGTVTVSATNAVYAGDFETIALKNAKQDLAGGVFPYTKLLKWENGAGNTASGFTAKFRVPDHIPYRKYHVIVSASVFGEAAAASAAEAYFRMTGYRLKDYACSLTPIPLDPDDAITGSAISTPTPGSDPIIPVKFAAGYAGFDPVLLHGFREIAEDTETPQRQYVADLLLKQQDGVTPVTVYPGYFIGLDIARCGAPADGTATWYTAQLGILSLRWNLVAVREEEQA